MPLETSLHPIGNGVNVLTLHGVTLSDLDEVDAWLYAIDMMPAERKNACIKILRDGEFRVCNIEHRIEIYCQT